MEEIKVTSDDGVQSLIGEEGLVKRPYLDAVKIPTIGVGMTYYPDTGEKVRMTDPPLTTERAIALFKMMLRSFELGVYSVTRDDINQNQFNACVMCEYNIGVPAFKGSTLLKLINKNPNDPAIQQAFEAWKNAGGKPILLARRKREAKIYFTPVTKVAKSAEETYTDHIKFIQAKLKITADGIFGKNTRAAVIAFQTTHGLIPDGIVGAQTLKELNKL